MISGAKRIVITIDTLVNGNMMIKSKKKRHSVFSASLKKNVYGYMYECYTLNTTMYSILFYLKRKDNYENSTK